MYVYKYDNNNHITIKIIPASIIYSSESDVKDDSHVVIYAVLFAFSRLLRTLLSLKVYNLCIFTKLCATKRCLLHINTFTKGYNTHLSL